MGLRPGNPIGDYPAEFNPGESGRTHLCLGFCRQRRQDVQGNGLSNQRRKRCAYPFPIIGVELVGDDDLTAAPLMSSRGALNAECGLNSRQELGEFGDLEMTGKFVFLKFSLGSPIIRTPAVDETRRTTKAVRRLISKQKSRFIGKNGETSWLTHSLVLDRASGQKTAPDLLLPPLHDLPNKSTVGRLHSICPQ